MNQEEITLKGNRILIAIEKGQVGLDASEFKKMQKAYVNIEKRGTTRFTIVIGGGAVCVLAGLALLISGPAIAGVIMLVLNGIFGASLFGQRKSARRYLEVIASEYPKVSAQFEQAA